MNLEYKQTIKKDPLVFSSEYIQKVDSTYIIGSGDLFEIVLGNTSNPSQVGAEGSLSINGLAPLHVDKLPLYQVKTLVSEILKKEYPNTQTDVRFIKKRQIKVSILGFVQRPNEYQVDNLSTLLELIHYAMGLEKEADQYNVLHIRGTDTTKVNLYELLKEGKVDQNIPLMQGDLVYVPKIEFGDEIIHYVNGGDYYSLPLTNPPKSLYSYLDELGFLSSRNVQSLIIRGEKGVREYTHAQAKQIYPVAGDTIDNKQNYSDVFVGGSVITKGPQKYNPFARPVEYIFAAGTSVMADQLDRVRVVRRDGTLEYIDPIKGTIYPGDYIELDMSALDYAIKWSPIFGTILGVAGFVWSIYYATVWIPNQ